MDQQQDRTPPEPEDARQPTEEQREMQDQLDRQDEDTDAPGLHQSRHDLPDESSR